MTVENSLLRESDACLELLEHAILADLPRVPAGLRARLAALARAAGHRRTRPPLEPAKACEFVFEVQDERLLAGGSAGAVMEVGRKPRRALKTGRPGPLFGSFDWLETRQSVPRVTDPEWAWDVWREATDLARLQPTPGRVAAMQEAWTYYWALVGVEDETAATARRAA